MTTNFPAGATRVVYRWPRARLVGVLGRLVLGLGAIWVAASVSLAWLDVDERGWFLGLGVVSLLVLGVAGYVLTWPPTVLELCDKGYRLRNVRAGGTAAARWTEVSSVSTGESVAGPVLVLEGHGRAPSVVPLVLLGPRANEAQQQVRALLQAAHRDRAS